jgi:hypothetical protein
MLFSQFAKNLNEAKGATESTLCFGKRIDVMDDVVYINGEKTELDSLEEARQYVKQEHFSKTLTEEVTQELYEDISETTIATIIKEVHDIKVTDTIIENYVSLASSNEFTVDPAVQKIRKLNKVDTLIEGKIHYVLEDGSTVAIDKRTQKDLNNLLEGQEEVVVYMKESKDNFMHALELLGK